MRPGKPISPKNTKALKILLREVHSKADFQRVLCVLLRAEVGLNSTQIAEVVGLSASTVKIVQMQYFKKKEDALLGVGRGGRRRENLSVDKEKALLQRFTREAEKGNVLVVSDIHAAYEREAGHPVPKSTVYRMLARHGWRKIAPRPKHPKGDPEARETFKKNSRSFSPRNRRGVWKKENTSG